MSAPNADHYARLCREAIAANKAKLHPELAQTEPEPTADEEAADE